MDSVARPNSVPLAHPVFEDFGDCDPKAYQRYAGVLLNFPEELIRVIAVGPSVQDTVFEVRREDGWVRSECDRG